MAPFDRLLRARIAGQAGLFSRPQALGAGITDDTIAWRVKTGRWVTVHPGVYLTTPGRDDWEMRAVAGLLYVGAPSGLRGASAAFAWGLVPSPPALLEVVVPAQRRGTSKVGLTVVRSRKASERMHPSAWPHRTTVEHTVLDLSMGAGVDRFVSLAARALQRGLASEQTLVDALSGRPNQSHRVLVTEALTDVAAGAESAAERRYINDVERAHGLPEGRRQARAGGLRRRDNEYDTVQVVVEIDGRLAHAGWSAQQRDGLRDREAAKGGRLTVRGYWADVAVTPCSFALDLGGIFRTRGWVETLRPCRRSGCAVAGAQAA
ncbi:hypothetical protein BA895_02890 [Humibacillus sp. DSM 29435]|uniref:type IV toxin-antitoxin system AbiEi family antitoxin domain-containing protein n=1 Tax=Humibacillus sp. DSM 29435 TaxID=1869167 RepID=UPI0008724777|nr:type IV toxin-antitoxin system AbiEi family antitoxin domain-containing protein [Humibacillus sp. DSM 29435]OFE16556.1 hypothetical protein BA895_02890 [Humibacillus sp. DSM 29435]